MYMDFNGKCDFNFVSLRYSHMNGNDFNCFCISNRGHTDQIYIDFNGQCDFNCISVTYKLAKGTAILTEIMISISSTSLTYDTLTKYIWILAGIAILTAYL